jgi:hypothetical protein
VTAEVLPQPKAATAVVFHDPATRTLSIRISENESGYSRLLWRESWSRLRQSQEAGWPVDGAPPVFADVPGGRRAVHGQPIDGGGLAFFFPVGTAGYAELVSKPIRAIVTMDTSARVFLGVRLFNRPAGDT